MGGTPTGPLWGDFGLVQLSRSSCFLLKTLGVSPPTVLCPLTAFCNELWALDVLPRLPRDWGGENV